MKKKKLKGLKLDKKIISNLDNSKINGGNDVLDFTNGGCTIGCTDGCGPFQTLWNCSRGNCTGDCTGGATYIC